MHRILHTLPTALNKMQPLISTSLPQIQCDHVSDARAAELRQHPAARDVGFGWLRIAQQEHFPDRVLLVSATSPVEVTFRHTPLGLDHMRASLTASVYACRNPQLHPEQNQDIDERDTIETPTAS
jgi:hypothetical protein